ncbi:MAG: transglycosylase SLT domain-containing protein [Myxococcota bacterium]
MKDQMGTEPLLKASHDTVWRQVYRARPGEAEPPQGNEVKHRQHSSVQKRGRLGRSGFRRGVASLAAAVLGFGALCVAPAADAEGKVYRFTDSRGVVHLTNVPPDRRYQVFVDRRRGLQLGPSSRKRVARLPRGSRYDAMIRRASRAHRLEPALVKAVIAVESNFDSRAVSNRGAQGLMQLMPETARELGVEDAFVPEENVEGGARYLRQMLDRFGDVRRALAAYNAGPSAVDRYRGVPPYPETQAYVDRVLTYYLGYGRTRRP